MTMPEDRSPMGTSDLPDPGAAAVDGLGCHSGRAKMQAAAQAAGKSETLAQYAKDYPLPEAAGPHEQPQSMCPARAAAKHVPGVRLAARGSAHAPHRHHPQRQRLLRLWPEFHFAFLRRAAQRRLRTLQQRSATYPSTANRWSPASCSRTSATLCMRRPTRRCTTASSSSTCVCPRPAACRCNCCPSRSMACASSASTCPASVCPRMRKPRMSWPVRCCVMPAGKPRPVR